MLILDNEDHKKLFQKAIDTWGIESQKMMAVGECGEFLAEFGRTAQGRSSPEKMIDEIADVIIMLNQCALIYGEDAVRARILYKIDKITQKLNKSK
jgi:NTP pyrophosphatase (non-canonical NTP hydrolase)